MAWLAQCYIVCTIELWTIHWWVASDRIVIIKSQSLCWECPARLFILRLHYMKKEKRVYALHCICVSFFPGQTKFVLVTKFCYIQTTITTLLLLCVHLFCYTYSFKSAFYSRSMQCHLEDFSECLHGLIKLAAL